MYWCVGIDQPSIVMCPCQLFNPTFSETVMLRTYPTNSPEAAGRVLAMALFSTGRCSAVELDTLKHLKVAERLGLTHNALNDVIHGFAQDMLRTSDGELLTFDRINTPTAMLCWATSPTPTCKSNCKRWRTRWWWPMAIWPPAKRPWSIRCGPAGTAATSTSAPETVSPDRSPLRVQSAWIRSHKSRWAPPSAWPSWVAAPPCGRPPCGAVWRVPCLTWMC